MTHGILSRMSGLPSAQPTVGILAAARPAATVLSISSQPLARHLLYQLLDAHDDHVNVIWEDRYWKRLR